MLAVFEIIFIVTQDVVALEVMKDTSEASDVLLAFDFYPSL